MPPPLSAAAQVRGPRPSSWCSQADLAPASRQRWRCSAIASAPAYKVLDVYNAFSGIVSPQIPNNLFALADPLAAQSAAKAFYEFKDVVKAAR